MTEMQWDLGPAGIALLAVMSLGFGAFTQAVFWNRADLWVGAAAAVVAFVVGIVISEGLFGWATVEELQPNIDGLSFDETLIGFLVGVPIVLLARVLVRAGDGPFVAR